MRDIESKITIDELASLLRAKGMISENSTARISEFAKKRASNADTPLIVKIIVGVGAWVASMFLVAFVVGLTQMIFGSIGDSSPLLLIILGIAFIFLAIVVHEDVAQSENENSRIFFTQSSFAAILAGKALVTGGVIYMLADGKYLDSEASILEAAIVLGITTGLTFKLYRLREERFISAFVTSMLFLIWLIQLNRTGSLTLSLMAYNIILIAGVAAVFVYGNSRVQFYSVGYSFALALPISIMVCSFPSISFSAESGRLMLSQNLLLNGLIAAAVVALCAWAAGGSGNLRRAPFPAIVAATVLLAAVSVPGVIVALGLMILGYSLRDKIITSIGLSFLPVFIFNFYYRLDISLMHKSLILMASGLVLVACGMVVGGKRAE